MLKIETIIRILFIFIISFTYINANEINDKAALNGIKEAKSVFLIDFTNVKKTAFYLNII